HVHDLRSSLLVTAGRTVKHRQAVHDHPPGNQGRQHPARHAAKYGRRTCGSRAFGQGVPLSLSLLFSLSSSSRSSRTTSVSSTETSSSLSSPSPSASTPVAVTDRMMSGTPQH